MPIRILEDRIQPGTTPSLGYEPRYPKVDMPVSVLEAQRANQNISSPSGMKLPGAYELMATAASPAINFARGLMGFQNPFLTQTMQDRMTELESKKGSTGSIGYGDYGLPVSKPGGRFTGGLFDLALSNPVDFGLAGSVGRYGFGPEGRTGLKYDFTPDQDTGSTGSAILDFINEGGVRGKLANLNIMGTAQAGEVPRSIQDAVAQVVAEGGSPSLIQDEARFDRIDKLLGIIPSEKPEETGTTGPTTSDYMVRNMLNQPTTEFLKERRSTPGTPSSKYLPQTRFRQHQLMNRRKQQMQQRIRQAEAAETNRIAKEKADAARAEQNRQAQLQAQVTSQANREAKRRISQGEGRDYGKTETRASSGWESSPFNSGGLVNFYRYGGFI